MPEDKNEDKKLPASLSGALGDLLTRTFGSAADEFGMAFRDKSLAYRLKNMEAIAEKALPMLEGLPMEKGPLPLKTALPLLEHASLEEDDYLREKWAALLVSSISNGGKNHYFPKILGDLTPLAVKMLDCLHSFCQTIPKEEWSSRGLKSEFFIPKFDITREDYDMPLLNLIRLGLCQYPAGGFDFVDNPDRKYFINTDEIFCITELGFAFATTCKSPKKKQKDDEAKP